MDRIVSAHDGHKVFVRGHVAIGAEVVRCFPEASLDFFNVFHIW